MTNLSTTIGYYASDDKDLRPLETDDFDELITVSDVRIPSSIQGNVIPLLKFLQNNYKGTKMEFVLRKIRVMDGLTEKEQYEITIIVKGVAINVDELIGRYQAAFVEC